MFKYGFELADHCQKNDLRICDVAVSHEMQAVSYTHLPPDKKLQLYHTVPAVGLSIERFDQNASPFYGEGRGSAPPPVPAAGQKERAPERSTRARRPHGHPFVTSLGPSR